VNSEKDSCRCPDDLEWRERMSLELRLWGCGNWIAGLREGSRRIGGLRKRGDNGLTWLSELQSDSRFGTMKILAPFDNGAR
jgi:hypothetical protein